MIGTYRLWYAYTKRAWERRQMKKDEISNEQTNQSRHDYLVDLIMSSMNDGQRQKLMRNLLDSSSDEQLEKIAMEFDLV